MRFSLKVQSIGGSGQSTKDYITVTHEFDVPDDQALTKRGRLFVTLNISANDNFDLKEISTLFIESLQESFYKINDETPLHAIEASLRRAHQLLLSIKSIDGNDSLGSTQSNFDISCATALIWNRVLYTSHIGSPAIYLIKGTGTRDLVLEKGSREIWTSSNIIENEDVVIIGTEIFANTFPATEIINSLGSLSSTIATHKDADKISAILIKASASIEKQSSSITDKVKSLNIGNSISGTIWKVKSKISNSEALSEKFKFYQSKKAAPVSSITGISETRPSAAIESTPRGPKRINERKSTNKGKKQIAVGLAMLLGIGFVNYKLFYENKQNNKLDNSNEVAFNLPNKDGQIKGESDDQTPINLHKEIIKFSNIEKNILPISLSTIRGNLISLDSNSGSVFKIDISKKEAIKLEPTVSNPKLIECEIHQSEMKDLCFVYGKDGFIVFDANKKGEEIDKYFADLENVIDIYPSWDVLYILTADNIYSYKLGTTEPKKWLNDEALSNTKSIAVDSNIYVLSSNDVYKYAGGKLVSEFKIEKSKLKSPTQIEISTTSIFVLDQNKIIVFKRSSGKFEKEILLSNEADIETPVSFSLTKDATPKIVFEKGKSFFIVEE
ncbi:hypothetical protein CO058_02850 [candidate division WWE3 bacterium CG_4_9_14_0_2_um_filter_35_11]|uniref:PPM-type phosphatase domain-containing protein n=1 Tax=candidate division WWE3 bacterium CG_4_9_14_0_2_um_filter_35_11 TaxID=1975077 RepID=A0A2M8ELB1_UNCKA|nr:MAG: hypothetical protein COV25_01780 [candidate division WWE3 bacterium CG10_big_fil_rev_8_21_14_0_10_35_32]PJC23521.1 MAG: hypothetical protein CO058_02850 [candidate division WWE3 bacterium CG_4_9_14_0_2_um_filter_35_11]